jgi:hypothetical protein
MINPKTATTFGLMRQPHRNATRVQDNSGPFQELADPSAGRLLMRQTTCAGRFLPAMIGGGPVGGSPHVRYEDGQGRASGELQAERDVLP